MDLEDIIKFENESTCVDFKLIEYTKENYLSLIKDVMAMANANTSEERYIIIGIEEKAGKKDLVGVSGQLTDAAIYQQIIHENIEPEINLKYYPYELEGRKFGVLEISNSINPPYMMKKDYSSLKKGDSYIRKGTTQMRMIRSDFDRIIAERSDQSFFRDDVIISITEDFSQEQFLHFIRDVELPSTEMRNYLQKLRDHRAKFPKSAPDPSKVNSSFFPYHGKSIDELDKDLIELDHKFKEKDLAYLLGERGIKLNFYIKCTGSNYIEDCTINVSFKKTDGFFLSPRFPKARREAGESIIWSSLLSTERGDYPNVKELNDSYRVSVRLQNLKHGLSTALFEAPLRIAILQQLEGQELIAEFEIFGKNLKNSLKKEIRIKIL
jgi:hypothetical protein